MELILEADVVLLVVGVAQALVDVAGNRLATVICEQSVGGEGHLIESVLLQGARRDATRFVTDRVVGEVGVVEADVLVDVVVQAVKADAEAAAYREGTLAGHVVREAETRTEALGVLVPDLSVALLEGRALRGADDWQVGQVRVAIGYGCAEGAEVDVGVEALAEVVRRSKIFPAKAGVHRQAVGDLPVVLHVGCEFLGAEAAVRIGCLVGGWIDRCGGIGKRAVASSGLTIEQGFELVVQGRVGQQVLNVPRIE